MSPISIPGKVTLKQYYSDPDFNNVSLLLHGDGANGSTTIIDSSPSPKTVTAVGNAQISTAQSKFGGSSLAFDGNGDYLSVPHSTDFELSNLDFTIEFWLRPTTSTNYWILGKGDGATLAGSSFSFYNGGTWDFYVGSGTLALARPTLTISTWQHIAVVRNSGTVTIYKDGLSISTGNIGTGTVNSTPSRALQIGLYSVSGYDGYIDDLRITRGISRYNSNFSLPPAPFPDA